MNFRVAAFLPVLVMETQTAFAEPALDPNLALRDSQIRAQAHFGVAKAPFYVPALPEAKGHAFVLLAAARYPISQPLSLQVRAPMVLGSIRQPAGSYVDAAALGNPQIGAGFRLFQRRSDQTSLALYGAVDIGAPLASHDEDLMPNRVLAIADGIEGRRHPEWFTPGVLPITPSGAFRWASAAWTVEAELRLPLLMRVSEADLPSTTTKTRSLGFASIVGVEARYRLSRLLSLASAAHLFFDVIPPVEHVRGVSRVQDFERISLHFHVGSNAALVVDVQTAIAGELGGSTVAGGLRAEVNLP